MSLFQRVPDPANEARTYSPLFHMLEDYSYYTRKASFGGRKDSGLGMQGGWSPNFDVKETAQTYVVHGDLPGIAQDEIRVDFTGDNTLNISGHKKRVVPRSTSADSVASTASGDKCMTPPVLEDSDDEGANEWQRVVAERENIDAATIGPLPGARRTSIVNAKNWEAPAVNIDQYSTYHHGAAPRRVSIVNARARQQPSENIDSYSHHQRLQREERRASVADASVRIVPVENIDAAFTGPTAEASAAYLASAIRPFSVLRDLPANALDAATQCAPKSMTAVSGPWELRPSRRDSQPWIFTERPSGNFTREFKFPTAVNRDGVSASLKDGVLTVVVPKRPATERRSISVSVA